MPNPLNTDFLINGSFGELYDENGNFLANVQGVDGMMRGNRRDMNRAGTRAVGYKLMTVNGEGTLRFAKTHSGNLRVISEIFRSPRQLQRRFTLRIRIDDPEALGVEEYRLVKVKFWETNFGFNVDQILEETIPFTFEGFEPISWIEGDDTGDLYPSRYTALS